MEVEQSIAVAIGGLGAAGALAWLAMYGVARYRQRQIWCQARDLFRLRREWLEAEFVSRGPEHCKLRNLMWTDCEFTDAVSFARHRSTGQLRAFLGVVISFETSPASGGESVGAVCEMRVATALFCYECGTWRTDGRVVFNLSPSETCCRYRHELEILE